METERLSNCVSIIKTLIEIIDIICYEMMVFQEVGPLVHGKNQQVEIG